LPAVGTEREVGLGQDPDPALLDVRLTAPHASRCLWGLTSHTGGGQKMTARKLAIVGAVAAAALATAGAAGAGAHAVTHYRHLPGNYTDDQCSGAPYGFDIQVTGYDDVTIKDTYDKQGNLVREDFHDKQVATATANGKTLSQSEDAKITDDYVNNTETWDGVAIRYTTPGGKLLIQDTGKIVFDLTTGDILTEHGQHPFAEGSTAVCDYFAS
jgi:hypothetical protein